MGRVVGSRVTRCERRPLAANWLEWVMHARPSVRLHVRILFDEPFPIARPESKPAWIQGFSFPVSRDSFLAPMRTHPQLYVSGICLQATGNLSWKRVREELHAPLAL